MRTPGDIKEWLRERRDRQEHEAEVKQRLPDDYLDRLAAGDRDTLDTSRDFYSNQQVPWWTQVGVTAYIVVVLVSVFVLGCVFSVIKVLTS